MKRFRSLIHPWAVRGLLLAAGIALQAAGADAPEPEPEPGPPAAAETAPVPPQLWFPVGEEIVYRIHWGRIRVGTTWVTTDWVEEEGRMLLRIRYRTRSNRFLGRIYPVDSLIESIIDPGPFRPVRFVKRMREGRRNHDEVTTFDWDRGIAHWVSHTRNRTHDFPIQPDTRCIPSLMYYLRRETLEPNREYTFQVMADDKTYSVTVRTEDYETVRLPRHGRVRSLRMEPTATFDGVFVRSGRMWLWVSEDGRQIATRISAEVPVARVHLTIDRVRGPGNDFWVQGEDDGDDGDEEN